MRKLLTVARFEFSTMAATKGFVISTVVGPILIAAMAILPGLLAGTVADQLPEDAQVGIAAGDKQFADELAQRLMAGGIRSVETAPEAELREMVQAEELNGYVRIQGAIGTLSSFAYVSTSGIDRAIAQRVEAAVGELVVEQRLEESGFDPEQVQRLTAAPTMKTQELTETGETEDQDLQGVIFTMLGFVLLVYMTILLYGQTIGRSALAEKQGKTVEIMLSSVDALHLMFGKIIGKGCAGLLQYVLWISVALLITQVLAPQLGATLPSALSGANLAWLLLFFLLAYFLYAGGYAAIGAAADDEQHLGQLGAPFIFMLLIPLVLISLIISSPNGAVAVVLSLVPFTSPVVMLARVVIDTPPLWQLLTSLGLLVGSVVAMASLAARLFRVAILMRGQRFTLAQVLKLARQR